LISFKGSTQNICNDSIEVDGIKLFCKSQKSKTGKIQNQYYRKNDSTLYFLEVLTNNRLDGSLIFFYPNSKIMSVQNFDSGITSSSYIKFYRTGIIKELGTFLMNSSSNKKMYADTIQVENVDDAGNIRGSFEYEEFNSPKNGVWQYFYDNGKLREQGAYKNNRREGEWKFYNFEGQLIGSKFFFEGKLQSISGKYSLME
jgi:uncharacterized protein